MIILLNDDILPANLSYLRKQHRLSLLSVAVHSGISVHYLRGIEKRHLLPKFIYRDYEKLCQTLGVSPTVMGTVLLEKQKEMTLD